MTLPIYSLNPHIAEASSLFKSAVHYTTGNAPFSIAIGDLNGDGYLDLAVTNEWSDNASILINTGDTPKFIDVPLGHWAEDAIYKIYKGCEHNPLMCCPSEPTTRSQMAVFLVRLLGP